MSSVCGGALRAASSALATAALVLGGCATPTPPVPDDAGVALPPAWGAALPGPTSAADANWWASFDDPVLSRLVAQAVRHNTSVVAAQANLREARALRNQAAASLLPSLSAGLGAQVAKSSTQPSHLFNAGLDAGWEADLFGANRHSVAAQDALVRASAATLESTRASVAAEVALAYLDLRNAQVRTAIARDNLRTQQETLQIARWREQAGLASSLDVEQANTSAQQTRAQIPVLEASAAAAAHAIAVLTGAPPAALLGELMNGAAVLPQPSPAAVAPPAETLARRPDVLAAQERVRAAAQAVGQADANRYPGLAFTASAQWSGLTLGSLGSVGAARSLVASLAAPVFDAGLRNAQLEQRRAQFDSAEEDWRGAVLGALQDVENALVALQATRERLAALRNALESARNASTLASQRYASGVIDFLTVLETQRTLLAVQDSVAAAEAELAQDQVRLYKAVGGGWQPAAQDPQS